MSTQQTVATVTVFDYELDAQGAPVVGATIIVTLNQQPASAVVPVVNLKPTRVQVTTDSNGYWSLPLIPNANINPANTVYNVSTPMYGTYQVSVPAGPGPYQASAIRTGAIPALVGGFTASGPGTVQGTLVVTGSFSANNGNVLAVSGALYALNQLQLGNPAAQILARAGQGLDFPSPGGVFFDRAGTGFTTATRQWGEAVLFGAGSDLGQWGISFWDSALAPKHSWVMGLGVDAEDSLQWATVTGQSVKMRLRYADGSLYHLFAVSPAQAGAAAITPDAAVYTIWRFNVNQNTALNAPANPVVGQLLGIHFIHDGTGNAYTVTPNAIYKGDLFGGPYGVANQHFAAWFIYDGVAWSQLGGRTSYL